MAGVIVPILAKTAYDFSFLGASASQSVVLHRALNVVPYRLGILLVRVHASTTTDTGQTIVLGCYGTDPHSDDPQEFTEASGSQMSITLTGNSASTAAGYLGSTIKDGLGFPYLKVSLQFNQSTSGARLYIELSADLQLREE